jgi:hypothetical protein
MKPKVVGFEVLTAVVTKSTIFWDITPCSSLTVNRRFEGTHRLHLHGWKISREKNQRESRWLCLAPAFTLVSFWLIFRPWRWRRYVPPRCQLTFNGLHGVISQNMALFKSKVNYRVWRNPALAYTLNQMNLTPPHCTSKHHGAWQ